MTYERYAKFRDEADMTDYAVAKSTGITASTLSDWKSGRYEPKVDKLIKISWLFGIPLEDFIGPEEEK